MRVSQNGKEKFDFLCLLSSGIRATCPLNDTQFFKPVDTPCNQFTQLCDRGVRDFLADFMNIIFCLGM
jgi:hypothetical protein